MKAKGKNIKFCFKAQKDAVQFQDKMDVGNQRQLRKSSLRADFGYWGGESSLVAKVCAQAKKRLRFRSLFYDQIEIETLQKSNEHNFIIRYH